MDPISYLSPTTLPSAEPPALSTRENEEQNAMEAVRELLFGKRVAEFHSQMEALEHRMTAAISRLENFAQQRFAELERSLQETERRLTQALTNEATERQQESSHSKKMVDERFGLVHRNMETFALETAKHLEARRSELHNVRKELAAETKHLRDHTPTLHGLAELFQQTSERLLHHLPTAPELLPSPSPRASTPSEVATFEGLPN